MPRPSITSPVKAKVMLVSISLPPFALDQRLDRVLPTRHLELPENVCRAGGLMLRLDIDVIGLFGIGACADQDELGAFIVEKMRVFRRKSPATELLFERFRIVRLFSLGKSGTWRRFHPGVLDREDIRGLSLDIELLLHI